LIRDRKLAAGMTTNELYDEWYFANCCGLVYRRDEHWLSHFGAVADRIVEDISPESALDAGCAMGFLVEALRDRGVDAEGIDVSDYALEHVREDVKPFCRNASILDPLPRRYDVIVCIEVLEHLAAEEGDLALDNICAHTEDVVFSSTPHDFTEATHVNVQPPEYWAERFARRGFFRDVDFDATVAARWAVRFRKDAVPVPRVIAGYERRLWRLVQENDATRAELLAQQEGVAVAEAERAEAQETAAEARADAEAARAEAGRERETAEAAERSRAEAAARAAEAEAALANLRATRTFRYTEPLRRFYVALRDRGSSAETSEDSPPGGRG
jgi:flagellar biosynthesis GTPase FlhF